MGVNAMRKLVLNQTLDSAFKIVDENIVKFKSSVIALCADIERYYKIGFGVDISQKIDEKSFETIKRVAPKLNGLNLSQINKLLYTFNLIRGVNAHLYLSKAIYLSKDLKDFILTLFKPAYFLEQDRRLTIYGCITIVMIFAQKYMIWSFVTSFFRHELFTSVQKGNEMSAFQVAQQKLFNSICGIGKPIPNYYQWDCKTDVVYINDLLKRNLTSIFFNLENTLNESNYSCDNVNGIREILRKDIIFNESLINDVVSLRNCWFHGCCIGDEVESYKGNFTFSIEFVTSILSHLKETCKTSGTKYKKVIETINCLAKAFLDFYALRVVEVTYKILDIRLLTEEKFEERVNNSMLAYERLIKMPMHHFKTLSDLFDDKEIKWIVSAPKFLDFFPRQTIKETLRIIKIHCEKGFEIGGFKTLQKDIVLADVDLDDSYKNVINGIPLNEIKGNTIKKITKFISIEELTI